MSNYDNTNQSVMAEYRQEVLRLKTLNTELLEALQAVYEMCDGYVPNTSKEVWRKAQAVILKATGAQS